jgi:hypothetical protein
MSNKNRIDTRGMVWSFSRLSSYDTCPYQFYATYVLGERDENNGWGILGGHAHETLEYVEKGELAAEEAQHYFHELLPPIIIPSMTDKYVAGIIRDCLHFFEELPNLELDFDKVIDIERKFITEFEGHKFTGFIDAEMKYGKDIVIRDWKTSGESGFKGKKLKEKARQMYLYSKAVKDRYGKYPKRLEFYMLRYQKPIVIDFKLKDYREAVDWAVSTIEKIENDTVFERKPQFFWCKNLCSSTSCENSGNYNKESNE